MAISFKSSPEYGYNILPLFGVSPELVATAKALGIQVKVGGSGMFLVQAGMTVIGSVHIAGSAITLAQSNNIAPKSKESIRFQFEAHLTKAISLCATPTAGGINHSDVTGHTDEQPAPPPVSSTPPVSHPVVGLIVEPMPASLKTLLKNTPTTLASSKGVYYPVKGTTSGSVYVTLMKGVGVSIAARFKKTSLSIRVEGSSIKSYWSGLKTLGLDDKGSYYSGHYDVQSKDLAVKALGALAAALGMHNLSHIADFDAITKELMV